MKTTHMTLLVAPLMSIQLVAGQSQPNKPNVVFIYADDIGIGDFSCYGARTINTPNVDRLAQNGIRFTNAHSAAATSTPSRYAMLTGEYAWRKKGTGIADGDAGMIIRPDRYTMADMFKQGGYATGVVGKWHLGLGNESGKQDWNGAITPGPQDIGFDYSYIMAATGDRVPCVFVQNDRVVNLDLNDSIKVSYRQNFQGEPTGKNNPELLVMHPSHGHDQSIVNGISRIGFMKGGKSALWKDDEIAKTLTAKAISYIEEHADEPFFLYFATQDAHVPRVPSKDFAGKSGMGPRGDCLLEFDWSVSQIIETLERLGLDKNTLVVISSDNGPVVDDGYKDNAVELLGQHKPWGEYRGGKYSLFEAGTRVPCILYWPQTIKPAISNALLCQMDWFASFAQLTNTDIPQGAAPDSEPLLNAWLGKDKKGRESLVLQNANNNLSIIQGEWKYMPANKGGAYNRYVNIETGNSATPQLYDLKKDKGETNNLVEKQSARAEKMDAALKLIIDNRYGLPL